MSVSENRLRSDIEQTGEFGRVDGETPEASRNGGSETADIEGWGRTAPPGSEANRQAREYLVERMQAAGLDVRVDSVGNIAGRWTPAGADHDSAPVAAGSHLDSVPSGGIFDGPLGVYAALESVRAMADAEIEPARPVEVVSFTEEEGGTFGGGLLGSSVAAGKRSVDEALALTDDEGRTLEEALDEMGFRGNGRLDASTWDAWLELHVEQHDRLERAGVPAGVVTTITGITHCTATVVGEANHAGTTPMDRRTDALAAASEFVLDVERAAIEVVESRSETAVGTVGSLTVEPNATNVVPGRVEMGVDVRDVDYGSMNTIVDAARETLDRLEAERGVETAFERGIDLEPTPMSERCRDALHEAGERTGIETMDLHSGAAHDTTHVADVTDAAMLFAPSRDGISHNPREWTDWADCASATRVLAGALAALSTGPR